MKATKSKSCKANPKTNKLSKAKRMTLQVANAQDNLQIKKGKKK
jgi:hypothetical protein